MITNTHPIVRLLDASEWTAHLIGSRYVGVYDRERSDYDFLVVVSYKDFRALREWLKREGFKREETHGYGPDRRLHDTNVWTWRGEGFPNVDVLPVSPEEAEMRLRFFAAMKLSGDTAGGLLAKALKEGKGWPTLWACLARFQEAVKEPRGGDDKPSPGLEGRGAGGRFEST